MEMQKKLAGYLIILAAITFWISWFLMPDPGTTDAGHILQMVKQSRTAVFGSATIQVISSVLFVPVLFLLVRVSSAGWKTMTGVILLAIGAMGLCADAFFHLLAYFMTDDSVNIQQDVVRVMTFMQSDALVFLVPLLLPLFIGSQVLAIGLRSQQVISRIPVLIFAGAFVIGVIGGILGNAVPALKIPGFTLAILGIFAIGQAWIGYDLIKTSRRGYVTVIG